MLPSSKRAPRHLEEAIHTGDFEVVHPTAKAKSSPPRPSDRPRAPQLSTSDEEATQLFSGSTRAMLPPRPAAAVQTPAMRAPRVPDMNLRGIVREGREKPAVAEKTNLRGALRPAVDAEDHTILRPMGEMGTFPPAARIVKAPAATATPKPAPRSASAKPLAMMPTPYQPTVAQQALKPTAPPVALSVNAPGAATGRAPAPSDPNGDPPSAVVTARTRIFRPRSTATWAAALVAVGAVVGLVTAVIARGDADSLIDATATIVDPHHGNPDRANGAAAQAAVLPTFMETAKPAPSAPSAADKGPAAPGACLDVGESTVSAPVVVNTPPPPSKTASLPEPPPARPTPPRPAPVAYAAPPRHEPRSAAPSAASQERSGSSGWLANATPPGGGSQAARSSKASPPPKAAGDFESAAAADALAKAQLEASLR